jgi:hypothetical protein
MSGMDSTGAATGIAGFAALCPLWSSPYPRVTVGFKHLPANPARNGHYGLFWGAPLKEFGYREVTEDVWGDVIDAVQRGRRFYAGPRQ